MRLRRFPLLAAGAAAVAFALPASPALASHSQFGLFEAPRELLSSDDGLRTATLDDIKGFGVTHVRVLLVWQKVLKEPDAKQKPSGFDSADPNADGYDWSTYDKLFAEAQERGIELIPTLTGPAPLWAARQHILRPDRAEFEKFVQAAGSRYGQQTGMWSVWNEPNLSSVLGPQFVHRKPYSPLLYRALYQAALQGLNASGNGGDKVLAAETAPRGNRPNRKSQGGAVAPVPFAKLFLKGKKLAMAGYAHHPYITSGGPFVTPKDPDTVSIAVLDRLTKVLNAAGYRKTGLYITEFGIQSKPDPIVGVSQTKQNDYRNYSEKVAYDNPRVKAFSQYLMRDDYDIGAFQSGLRTADGEQKLAYVGYQVPVVAQRASKKSKKVRLWGLVRAAGGATVTVQQRDGGGDFADIGTAGTNRRGYWTKTASYKKGRTFRVVVGELTSPPASIH